MPLLLTLLLALSFPSQTLPSVQTSKPNPDANGIYRIEKGVVTAPEFVYPVEPEFPEKALRRKIYAAIELRIIVDTDGHVRDVEVVHSAAEPYTNKKDREAASLCDQAVVEAAKQYRFKPGLFQGQPVPVAMSVQINFPMFGADPTHKPY